MDSEQSGRGDGVMNAPVPPSKENFARDVMNLQRALRVGNFPEEFADLWNGLGLECREEIERVGEAVEQMFRVSGKGENVRRRRARTLLRAEVSHIVKRSLKHNDKEVRNTARYFFEWICDLMEGLRQLEEGRGAVDYARLARAFGAVKTCVCLLRKEDGSVDMASVVDMVAQELEKDGIGHTDVRRAINLFTKDVSIDSWLDMTIPERQGGCA